MKNSLAVDVDHVLNIYITSVDDPQRVAWGTFPDTPAALSNPNLFGVVLDAEVLYGGSSNYFNMGKQPFMK